MGLYDKHLYYFSVFFFIVIQCVFCVIIKLLYIKYLRDTEAVYLIWLQQPFNSYF